MKLATIPVEHPKTVSDRRDGRLVILAPDRLSLGLVPREDYPNLLDALERWEYAEPRLREIEKALADGAWPATEPVEGARFLAPLPRTWSWLDGSAFIQHIVLVRKARGAEPPEDLKTVPLMYQGISDGFLGPTDDIPLLDPSYGLDFEAEVAVVLDDVPLGTTAADAHAHIKLLLLMNDVSLRMLIPRELKAGFGFFHGKPVSSFAPFAVTPDALGAAWKDGRLHLEMRSSYNGSLFGHPNAKEMFFGFHQLIEHAAKTRALPAGTILGSGTVSNEDESVGSSCLAEKRMLEQIHNGTIVTPFMKAGDTIEIEMLQDGESVFGKIAQTVTTE
ncbi:MAG: 2-keto-4-pentenoate hydratase [Elusimicrobia bacterium CG_4_10_14_0_2_um_filter_63_34]|nr:MAG: 2-keto-4-pentenoate hydratase [Elusimicrobia bacterium CG_4_10_14_0_2_um_filter_63_34]